MFYMEKEKINENISVSNKKEKKDKKKTSKKKKIIISSIIVFLCLVISAPIITIYYLFYDDNHSTFVADDDYLFDQTLHKSLTKSIEYTRTTELLNFMITEEQLNNILALSMPSMPDYVTNFTVDVTDDRYTFMIDITLPIFNFKSKVSVFTKITDDNDSFYFHIEDVVVGKIHGLTNILISGIESMIESEKHEDVDDVIDDTMDDAGIDVDSDIVDDEGEENKDPEIVYDKDQIILDLKTKALEIIEGALFVDFIQDFYDLGIMRLSLASDNVSLQLETNLKNTNVNPTYIPVNKGSVITTANLDLYMTYINDLLKRGVITINEGRYVLNYLINGYNNYSMPEFTLDFLSSVDLSMYGINDYKNYKGANLTTDVVFSDVLTNQLHATLQDINDDLSSHIVIPNSGTLASISETDINSILKTTSLIGYSYVFSYKEKDDYYSSYVTFNDIYAEITDNNITFIASMNINGFESKIIINTLSESFENNTLVLKVDEALMGTYNYNIDKHMVLYTLLSNSFSKLDWISFNSFTKTLKIKVDDIMSDFTGNTALNYLQDNGDISLELDGESIESDGSLNINYKLN